MYDILFGVSAQENGVGVGWGGVWGSTPHVKKRCILLQKLTLCAPNGFYEFQQSYPINFPLHFLTFRFTTAAIRENYVEHCKIACRFALDLEPGGTLRNVQCYSTLDRYWEGGGGYLPLCAVYHTRAVYVDAKYTPYITLYFEGCARIKKRFEKNTLCYDFRCHKSDTRLREFMPSSYTTDFLQTKNSTQVQ